MIKKTKTTTTQKQNCAEELSRKTNTPVKSLDKRERVSENIFVSVIESVDFIDETSLDVSDDKCSSISEEVALTVGGNDVVRTREADRET